VLHVLLMSVPETPNALIAKNKIQEAKKSLAWFRHAPTTDLIEEEFNSVSSPLETFIFTFEF